MMDTKFWLAALLVTALALAIPACADQLSASPDDLRAFVQASTDSTAVVTLSWSPPTSGGPVEGYAWSIGPRTGTTDSTAVEVELPQRDTAYTVEASVRATGPGGESPEATTTATIPRRIYEAPGTPEGLEAGVDTTSVAMVDSASVYASRSRIAPDESVQVTAVFWSDGIVAICRGACDTIPGWSADQDATELAREFTRDRRLASLLEG